MHLVIHDASLRKVAFVDNTKQTTLKYIKYEWYRSLETAGSTFNVTIQKKAIQTDNRYEVAYNHLNERSFITFKAKNKTHLFSVMVVTENEETITCECESANLELINEYANPYKANKAMTFVEYCNAMDLLSFTYLTIGLNEVSDKSLTLEWEGQDTKLARLLSLAKKFDAEIEFDTRLNADSSIKQFILNVYHKNDNKHQGVGRVREDVQLVYGKNVKSVTRTIDKTNVVNAIRPTGTKDGNTVVISGLGAWEEKNEDGVVEFYQKGEMLYAPISMQLYPSTFTNDTIADQWTRKDITVDSDNPTVIRAEGIKALKRLAYPYITYEVDGFFDADVGDTVKVIDNGFVPKLILKARVVEQYIYDDETKNKTVLGNFTALENRISDDMQARLNELVEQAKPYTIKLSTNNGVVFKNQGGETVVTPKLYKGGQPSASSVVWNWTLDGVTTTGMTYTVRGANVTDTATLTIAAYIGNDEVAVDEISFVNVLDGTMGTPGTPGKDGRTPYVHTAWANNETGTDGFSLDSSINKLYIGIYTDFEPADSTDATKYNWTLIKGEKGDKGDDGVAGKDGIGIDSTVITYASSSSGTSAPTTGWGGTVPTVPAGNYLWTKTVWNYSDGISETGYSVARIGKDGNTGADGIAGKDGVGIKTTTITYAKSTNGTTAPTSGWTTSVPIAVDGDYIWTKTVWVYTDNTTETGYSVGKIGNTGSKGDKGADGVPGKDGVGIKSTAITYGLSTSDSVQPINWTTTVPNLVKGQYLWTKTVWTYSDSTNETGYTKTYIAKDGNNGTDGIAGKDGVGIVSTTITYGRSTSGTSNAGITWTSSVPNVPSGEFLWTKTVWNYSDQTSETGYSVAKMGEKGDKGLPGPKGADGKSSYTHIAYANMTQLATENSSFTLSVRSTVRYGKDANWFYKTFDAGTYTATNATFGGDPYNAVTKVAELVDGFSTSNSAEKAYIGVYVDFNSADSTNPADYNWTLIKGSDGAQGIPGVKGADGRTPYVHWAYSDNADGTGLTLTDNGQRYIGQYSDYTQADSTDKTKYRWADRWAKIEVDGRNLAQKTSSAWSNPYTSFSGTANTCPFLYKVLIDDLKVGDTLKSRIVLKYTDIVPASGKTSTIWLQGEGNITFWNDGVYNRSPDRPISGSGEIIFEHEFKITADHLKNEYWNWMFRTDYIASGSLQWKLAKVEKGTVFTGWSPAPEDVENKLDTKADQALTQRQLNMLIEKAQLMQTELKARVAMETLSDLERAYNAYVEANDKAVEKSQADLIEAGRRVDAMVETLGGLSKTKKFIDTYIKEAEEGITIGTNDNVSQIRIIYDRIAMYSAGKEVMYISQGVIHIDNGVFTKTLQIGRFRTERHQTNLDINVCRYVG